MNSRCGLSSLKCEWIATTLMPSLRIERRTRCTGACTDLSRSAFRQLDLVQGRLQASRQLSGIIVCPEMHEEQPRLFGEHVAVQRRHLDPALAQGLAHGIDLLRDEHEVTCDRRFAAATRL